LEDLRSFCLAELFKVDPVCPQGILLEILGKRATRLLYCGENQDHPGKIQT